MKRRKTCLGSNLVEGTVTTLLFFTVMFAVFDFGRALNVYHAMTDAAREGARFSVAPYEGTATLPSIGAVAAKTATYLAAANINACPPPPASQPPGAPACANVGVSQITPQAVNGVPLLYTTVTITFPYKLVFLPFTVTLSTNAQMRNETN